MGQLDGRVALITGGGEGIGRGLAAAYLKQGARVVIAEFNDALGQQTAKDLANLTRGEVAETVARFGTIDILVNNAWSGGEISRVERKSDQTLERAFAVGYYGPYWAMQAAYSTMRANEYGRIINLCSLNGVNAHMGSTEYNSAKEALRALTRTAAREWAGYGITANVICPGAKSAAFHRVMASNPELVASADAANPMGRLGDPEDDIGPVAVFLASEGSKYLTGNTLFVDGGSHINGSSWAPDLPE
jgi:NAD(P)-dependent dehydrogenase (short-subunit alcohol dehydrogenase family)